MYASNQTAQQPYSHVDDGSPDPRFNPGHRDPQPTTPSGNMGTPLQIPDPVSPTFSYSHLFLRQMHPGYGGLHPPALEVRLGTSDGDGVH